MSVVCVLCNILSFVSTMRVWAPCVVFSTCGALPHYAIVHSITCPLGVDYHTRWQGSQVRSAGWDHCTLHSPIHYCCKLGATL